MLTRARASRPPPARLRARAGPVLLDVLASPRCLACRARGWSPWCPTCATEVRPLPAGCPRCGTPRRAAHRCWPAGAPITSTALAYDYQGTLARGLATAKLAGAHAAWPALVSPLVERLHDRPPAVDVVTWVTTPGVRVRARGLDHAEHIARRLAAALVLPAVRLLDASVTTDGDRYRARRALPGTEVLLVDDILTTGRTAWRAAGRLQAAGAGRVHLAVLARAGTHALGP